MQFDLSFWGSELYSSGFWADVQTRLFIKAIQILMCSTNTTA
jgi:hypothetical protein